MSKSVSAQDVLPQPDTVAILLALYNGADNLVAQLDSYTAQTYKNWSLIVSDDGSDDAGPKIIAQFQGDTPNAETRFFAGPGKGFVANFLGLIQSVGPDAGFAALSDQDDVWCAGKLARAVAALEAIPADQPALYCSRTYICGAALEDRGMSPLFEQPTSFENALVQNIAGGNTMVVNRAALDLLQAACPLAGDTVCHDWWMYQMVSGAGGTVIYDPKPTLKYRQHAGNLIGANNTTRASLSRLKGLMQGAFKDWNRRNIATLQACSAYLTPHNQDLLEQFAKARQHGPLGRLRALRQTGVYRQTKRGHIALLAAAVLGKI